MPRVTRRELAALAAVVALAAALRFGWGGVSSFAWDEANLSLDALRTARGGQIALAGQPSSVAIPFFPASVYAFALPYILSPDPQAAVWFVAALSLATVAGVWALGRALLRSAGAGVLAALLLAASPYAVLYGRSIWQPNLLPPLALAWLAAAYAASSGRRWALALCVFLGGAAVQVHFAGVALTAGTALLFLYFRWWRAPAPVLIGGAAALLLALPYGVFLTQNPDVLARYGAVLGGETRYDLTGFENALKLALNWNWGYLGGGETSADGQNAALAALAGALLALGMVGLARRGLPRHVRALLALALLISPLFFVRHSTPVLPHYQLVALPALALLAGAGWRTGGAARYAGAAAALALAAGSTGELTAMLNTVSAVRPPNSALSSILREPRDAAHAAADPVIVHLHGDDPRIEGEAAVFAALLWGRPHRIVNGDVLLVLSPEPATLFATLAPFQAWEELESGGLASDSAAYPRRTGALPFVAARYDGAAQPAGFTRIDPVAFADGTTLLGWKIRWVGARLRISTLWTAGDLPEAGIYQQFHHLRTPDALDGAPFAISDVPLSLHTWQAGDTVVVMADFFDMPPGSYWLDLGHYTLPDLIRVLPVGVADTGGDFVRLGLFVVEPP